MIKEWNFLQAIATLIQAIAICIGGVWAYRRLKVERTHCPHIELKIDCNFFGLENEEYIAEFILHANNKGSVRQEFKSIKLRTRGIEGGEALEYFEEYEPRLKFGNKLFEAEVIHEKYNYIFVEPGVNQEITYVSKVPATCKYLLCRAEFSYDRYTPHSIEKVFEVDRLNEKHNNPAHLSPSSAR